MAKIRLENQHDGTLKRFVSADVSTVGMLVFHLYSVERERARSQGDNRTKPSASPCPD
jgi:hypothetical protein